MSAAAAHFVAAGIATGCDGGSRASSCATSTDSRLSGISSAASASANVPKIFINNSDQIPFTYGNDIAYQICYLFTGSYNIPCTYLSFTSGPITAFPGLTTAPTGLNQAWWMFTQGVGSPTASGAVGNDDDIHRPELSTRCPFPPCDPFDDTL